MCGCIVVQGRQLILYYDIECMTSAWSHSSQQVHPIGKNTRVPEGAGFMASQPRLWDLGAPFVNETFSAKAIAICYINQVILFYVGDIPLAHWRTMEAVFLCKWCLTFGVTGSFRGCLLVSCIQLYCNNSHSQIIGVLVWQVVNPCSSLYF